jgi:hypothetical protein
VRDMGGESPSTELISDHLLERQKSKISNRDCG